MELCPGIDYRYSVEHPRSGSTISFIAFISLMGWGLGYFGQPHILVLWAKLRFFLEKIFEKYYNTR